MNRKEKIQWLKDVQSGRLGVDEARKQLAITTGHRAPLLGIDLAEYKQGVFPGSHVVLIKGVACRVLTKDELTSDALEETYE